MRNDVDLQNAYDVASAIKGVLEANSRDVALIVTSDLVKVQVFSMFNASVDTVPYKEFNLSGTRTISLPPGKYMLVFTRISAESTYEIWSALLAFNLTEV